jgi:sec-independent protein translocase protein TatB
MFDFGIGLSELLILLILALLVIGPEDLPKFLYQMGKIWQKIRQTIAEFQNNFENTLHEQEIQQMRADIAKKLAEERQQQEADQKPSEAPTPDNHSK